MTFQETHARVPHLALTLAASELGFHVHAGFLDALTKDAGISPAHIGAASSGSYVGGLYAAGFDPQDIHRMLSRWEMLKSVMEWKGPLRGIGMLMNIRGFTGLVSGRKLAAHLRKYIGNQQIEHCEASELSLSVTNLTKGCSEIIRKGPLVDFIVASCSVPGLFKCQTIGGEAYCDGAVSDSSPFHHFLEEPRVSQIMVHVVRHADRETQHAGPLTISGVFGQSHQIITDRLLDISLECGRLKGKKVLLLTSVVPRYRWAKKGTPSILFEAGRQTVLKNIEQIHQALS
jgi:predicted acylesterase/phospholipase RssA